MGGVGEKNTAHFTKNELQYLKPLNAAEQYLLKTDIELLSQKLE